MRSTKMFSNFGTSTSICTDAACRCAGGTRCPFRSVHSAMETESGAQLVAHEVDENVLKLRHIHFHLHRRGMQMRGRHEVSFPFLSVHTIRSAVGQEERGEVCWWLPDYCVSVLWAVRNIHIQIHGLRLLNY